MDNKPDPKGNKAAVTLMWLMVGLAPILIILSVGSSNAASNGSAFILASCIICNLLGGFGCARNVKDWVVRIFLGLFLAVCFFVVCVIVAVFEACSQMKF